jgi:parvulin-like peptidyl-prolyl isomerase
MDVSAQLQQIESQLAQPLQIGQTVLDQMINEELIRQESAKRGLTISDEQIEKAIQADMRYFPDGTPTPTITPTEVIFPTLSSETYKLVSPTPSPTVTPVETATSTVTPETIGTIELLPSPTATTPPTATPTQGPTPTPEPTFTPLPTSTPYTLEGFQGEYQNNLDQLVKYGLTEEQYRNLYKANLLREMLIDAVTADVPHEEEQVWARHILVADEETAKSLIERLKNGEDFGALAAQVSMDSGTAVQGGDLGWFGKGVMVPEFETAAFALKVGEISQPIQSSFGWHIIQVLARQNRPLTDSEYQSARNQAFSNLLTSLREEYGVETFDAWKQNVPTDPDFSTVATEAAQSNPN